MTKVPLYWYSEPESLGGVTEVHPWGVMIPTPLAAYAEGTSALTVVDANGEVQCEAILMGRLPWPRFRRAVDGQQVQLPARMAVALERLEAAMWMQPDGKPRCCACGDQLLRTRYEFRVEVIDVERVSCDVWCLRHWPWSFSSGAKRGKSPRRDKRRVSYRGAKLRDQEPATEQVNRERLDISLHK